MIYNWLGTILDEIRKHLALFLSSLGLIFILPAYWVGTVDYQLQHPLTGEGGAGSFGDFSNWFQALIGIWTLLAVFYTAYQSSLIAKNSNNIAKDSAIISERSYVIDLVKAFVEEANSYYKKHLDERQKWNICNTTIDFHEGDTSKLYEELTSLFNNRKYYNFILDGIIMISKCIDIINNSKYKDDESMKYYANTINIFLDGRLRSELVFRIELGWVEDQTIRDEMIKYHIEHIDYLKSKYDEIEKFFDYC